MPSRQCSTEPNVGAVERDLALGIPAVPHRVLVPGVAERVDVGRRDAVVEDPVEVHGGAAPAPRHGPHEVLRRDGVVDPRLLGERPGERHAAARPAEPRRCHPLRRRDQVDRAPLVVGAPSPPVVALPDPALHLGLGRQPSLGHRSPRCAPAARRARPGGSRLAAGYVRQVLRRHVELHPVDAIAPLAPGDRRPLARVRGGPAGHDQDAGRDPERLRDLGTARKDLDLPLQPAELDAGPVPQHLQQRVAHLLRLEAGGERRRHVGAVVGDHLAVDQPEQLHDRHAAPPPQPEPLANGLGRVGAGLVAQHAGLELQPLPPEVLLQRVERREEPADLGRAHRRPPPSLARHEPAPLEEPERPAEGEPAHPEAPRQLLLGLEERVGRRGRDLRAQRLRDRQVPGGRSRTRVRLGCHAAPAARRCHRSSVARRAPSPSAASFAHAMRGSIQSLSAKVPNPQSVPAITFSRPTTLA